VAGGFLAVRCDRPVQGGAIGSTRTRPRPIGDGDPSNTKPRSRRHGDVYTRVSPGVTSARAADVDLTPSSIVTMIRRMRYPGGKGKTYQHVINLMPPHRVYIETHLGGGAVMRHKRPAERNIGLDADTRVIESWADRAGEVELFCTTAEDFLRTYDFRGDELLYVDPPYFPTTRRRARVYRHDYAAQDHEQLVEVLGGLPCKIILSGYANPFYERALSHWRTHSFEAKTHTEVRVETLWFNFERPPVLHDSRYLGDDFRQRQVNRRRMLRLQDRVARLAPAERAAFTQWLCANYAAEPPRLSP
jgi:DNA adenine methylase